MCFPGAYAPQVGANPGSAIVPLAPEGMFGAGGAFRSLALGGGGPEQSLGGDAPQLEEPESRGGFTQAVGARGGIGFFSGVGGPSGLAGAAFSDERYDAFVRAINEQTPDITIPGITADARSRARSNRASHESVQEQIDAVGFSSRLREFSVRDLAGGGFDDLPRLLREFANVEAERESFFARINAAALATGAPGTRSKLEGTGLNVPSDFDPTGQFVTDEDRALVQSIFDRGSLGRARFSADDRLIAPSAPIFIDDRGFLSRGPRSRGDSRIERFPEAPEESEASRRVRLLARNVGDGITRTVSRR